MLLVIIFFVLILAFAVAFLTLDIKIHIRLENEKKSFFFKLYIFKHIPIATINIKKIKNKVNKSTKANIQKVNLKKVIPEIIKKWKINIEEFKLKVNIGTFDAILTSYTVAFVAATIPIIINTLNINVNHKNFEYNINPVYEKKVFSVKFTCIISFNVVHIITIIYTTIKEWRCKEYGGKTSNRKSHGHGYEQYKANDRRKYYNWRANRSVK